MLVGFDHADDAGVYQIAPDTALVQTVDFFTPIVDDPYTFGQIAATNSLSDVYAMGGRPVSSLALVCFPEKADLNILERILAGGLSKMMEAGCTVIGGHSIRDEETKFGYSVTGLIHPQKVLANEGAKPGDALVLTKALGTGVISTAIKKEKADQTWIDAAVKSMTTLNKTAAEVITGPVATAAPGRPAGRSSEAAWSVHALTDITGFGLIGHAREMALASNVSLRIFSDRVPVLPGALESIRAGYIPGGLKANREFAECVVGYEKEIAEDLKTLLFDPQTAGGLFVSLEHAQAHEFVRKLEELGLPAARVGEVLESGKPLIKVS